MSALDALEAALEKAPGPLFGGSHLNAVDAALAPKVYHAFTSLKHFRVGGHACARSCVHV